MRASEREGIRREERQCTECDTLETVHASKDLVGEKIRAPDSIVPRHTHMHTHVHTHTHTHTH